MELVDCINYKRRQLAEQARADKLLKEELVAKCREYFINLDEGGYEILYSEVFDDWIDDGLGPPTIFINIFERIKKKRFRKSKYYKEVSIFYHEVGLNDIDDWDLDRVKIFHYSLDTILHKIGEELGCK